MCQLSLYDVIRITRHLHIKLKSFSNIAQPLHKEAVRGCSFCIGILVDVNIHLYLESLTAEPLMIMYMLIVSNQMEEFISQQRFKIKLYCFP